MAEDFVTKDISGLINSTEDIIDVVTVQREVTVLHSSLTFPPHLSSGRLRPGSLGCSGVATPTGQRCVCAMGHPGVCKGRTVSHHYQQKDLPNSTTSSGAPAAAAELHRE